MRRNDECVRLDYISDKQENETENSISDSKDEKRCLNGGAFRVEREDNYGEDRRTDIKSKIRCF